MSELETNGDVDPTTEDFDVFFAATDRRVGEILPAKNGAQVTRPSGATHTVSGGGYVLDVPGTYVVDGTEVKVD